MKATILATAMDIAAKLISDIETKISTNAIGEKTSDYHAFLENEHGDCISVQLTEETCGLVPMDYFYSLHLVDNITGKNCDLYYTDEFNKKSVVKLVAGVMCDCIRDIFGKTANEGGL